MSEDVMRIPVSHHHHALIKEGVVVCSGNGTGGGGITRSKGQGPEREPLFAADGN